MSAVKGLATPTITKKTLWEVFGDDIAATRNARPIEVARHPVHDGRGQRKQADAAWNRTFERTIIALVTAMPSRAPEGLVHLAADIADAATGERQRRGRGVL